MDNNGIIRRHVTDEQRKAVEVIPPQLNMDILQEEIESRWDSIANVSNVEESAKKPIPIYNLKADEEARSKLVKHEEEAHYEALVTRVKEWEALLADKDELDHRALAVLLDDSIMFEELKRSHKMLDDTYAYITHETNMWEKHEQMYDTLLKDIQDESSKCQEAKSILDKLM